MFYGFGNRQHEFLETLLFHKKGMTIDELSKELGITRTAVQQHALSLEQAGYVEKGSLTNTGGRPGQVFVLSEKGIDLFPKQYSWFSELLLKSMKTELGGPGLEAKMREIGRSLAQSVKSRLQNLSVAEKIQEVSRIMQELGYKAETVTEQDGSLPVIQAHNCIYHHLAKEVEEVCHLDTALLESLLDKEVVHEECMVRDGEVCKFRVRPDGATGQPRKTRAP